MRNDNFDEPCKVLVVSPHPDDAEMGCGGSIAKHITAGYNLYVILLSKGERSGEDRIHESVLALAELGVKSHNVLCVYYPDTLMHNHIADIGDTIKEIADAIMPNIVYIPTREDLHQDHIAVNTGAFAGIKDCKSITAILQYETSKSMETFSPNYYEVLNTSEVNAKHNALLIHKSQNGKPYMFKRYVQTRMMFRGYQTGSMCMAEAFIAKIINK